MRHWGSWQGGEKTEDGEVEHRERLENGGGGQGGKEREEKTDVDEEEETVDGKTSEGTEISEMRGDFRQLYGPESCTRCLQNPFECGCLDVNFESRGARNRREKRERERANWNLKRQM